MANVPTKKLKVTGKFGSYGEDGGYYTPVLTQTSDDTAEMSFVPSKEGMYEVPPQTIKLPGASTGLAGSGVYIGNEAPDDPNVNVWVDPDEISDIPEFVPVPETAEVGQTVVVKAVDENGKPTEWEPKTDYPAYADPEGWEHIKTVTVASSDNVWRLIINVDADGNKFAYDELILFTDDLAATSNSVGRIFINRLSPYQNYYANFSNFFVTNAQTGGTTHISILKRDLYNDEGRWSSTGHMYTFQSRTNTGFVNRFRSSFDGNSGMNAWNSEEFAKKICSFGIQTSGETVYMRGTFKLFGRNYK